MDDDEKVIVDAPLPYDATFQATYTDYRDALANAQRDVELAADFVDQYHVAEETLLHYKTVGRWRVAYLKETGPPRVPLGYIWDRKTWQNFAVGVQWRMTMHVLLFLRRTR